MSPPSHGGAAGYITDQVLWDLWWMNLHWGKFSSQYFAFPYLFLLL
jgi:hypothetical protein